VRCRDDAPVPRLLFSAFLLAGLGLLIAGASPAAARLLAPPASGCPEETLEQPFTRWSDHRFYTLVPDGGFENDAHGWTRAGAEVVAGNQSLSPRTSLDAHSLAIGPWGRATSPAVCVTVAHPTARFFARNTGSPLGSLLVEVIARTSLGTKVSLPIGLLTGAPDRWTPGYAMPLLFNLLTITGGDAGVALRFTAVGRLSSWEIDDVYVDPYSKR
jgi:hypothetical protein